MKYRQNFFAHSTARTLLLVACAISLASVTRSANAAAAPDGNARLTPLAAEPLPLGAIKPEGWLKRQLQIQAKGLGGHLDEFWPDVKDSSWIGGNAEGWERGPYWLDGFLPLAIELDDPALKARAKNWIDFILQTQREDGWIGPNKGNPSKNSKLGDFDAWPRFIVLKALTQWQEATGDERIIPSMTRFMHSLDKVLDEHPLQEWARVRWADMSLSIYWLYDRTKDPSLLKLADKVRRQGIDWSAISEDFPFKEKITGKTLQQFKAEANGVWINDKFGATHGVNVAMGVKAPGVWWRQSNDPADLAAIRALPTGIDQFHGQANGMFSCDEHLAGRNPSQGTELCTVVEMMFSLETLLSITPDVAMADRLERIAFNALPAAFSDDMWSHQYDQQANQVVCKVSPERIYSNNGPDANLFGLAPNFACCLANFHQGWPKFVSHLWMRSSAGGLAAMAYAPCDIKTTVGGNDVQVAVRTDYPFTDVIDVAVTTTKPAEFPIDLRIPSWAPGATVMIEGAAAAPAKAGEFHRITRQWSGTTHVRLTLPMPLRTERRTNDSVVVARGPLVMSLKIGQEWKKLKDRPPTADWEVHPKTSWNYALAIDPAKPEASLKVETREVAASPFSPESPAVSIKAKAKKVAGWDLFRSAAAEPPKSPVSSKEPLEDVELIPYGSAKLRVTEMPVLSGS